ncbi:hypothetical protein LTR53_016321 [Teratosphaeriaceae sp. CCFEE 6253]|nr:hypothetical protein LTR53_016321 [Teratosphaeriaceae sp. CCFEE 6253]
MSLPSDAVLPKDSLVLVTGVNGYLGCHVADQLLRFGFRVRGTARDASKNAWIQEHYDQKYGAGKHELVEVKKLDAEGALDEAVKGCSGVIHVASNLSFSPDPNIVVNDAINFTMGALSSAAKAPSVKRFVLTSSSAAAGQAPVNEPYTLTQDSWATKMIEIAWAPPPYEQSRMFPVYAASKAQAEQAMWKFVREQQPHFVANSVLPDFITGLPINVEKQGYGPSSGMLVGIWKGDEFFKVLPPQWAIDVKDTALLHVAALLAPDAQSERVFGYAFSKTWTDWIGKMRKWYPDHTFIDPPENEGADMPNILGRDRAEGLLKYLGQDGWRPVDESIREVCDTLT